MAIKIDRPIVRYSVVEEGDDQEKLAAPLDRPEVVYGKTYKLRRPGDSLYLTINRDDEGNPIELFLNSRDMNQSHVAVTRLASAMLRAKIPLGVVVEELKAIRDPDSGYFIPGGGGYAPSTMAHLGKVLEQELRTSPLQSESDEGEVSRAQPPDDEEDMLTTGKFCSECQEYAIHHDGVCEKCFNCGESKCG